MPVAAGDPWLFLGKRQHVVFDFETGLWRRHAHGVQYDSDVNRPIACPGELTPSLTILPTAGYKLETAYDTNAFSSAPQAWFAKVGARLTF